VQKHQDVSISIIISTQINFHYTHCITATFPQSPILGISALHLSHPKCTHTRSSGQPFFAAAPREQLGFGALLKRTSVVVLKVGESAVHSLPPPTIPASTRLEPATFGLRVRLSNHYATTSQKRRLSLHGPRIGPGSPALQARILLLNHQ